jgi:hypothetical protein
MGPKTKRFTFLLCFLSQASALVFIGCGGAQKPANGSGTAPSGITGNWNAVLKLDDGSPALTLGMALQQSGSSIAGSIIQYTGPPANGGVSCGGNPDGAIGGYTSGTTTNLTVAAGPNGQFNFVLTSSGSSYSGTFIAEYLGHNICIFSGRATLTRQ